MSRGPSAVDGWWTMNVVSRMMLWMNHALDDVEEAFTGIHDFNVESVNVDNTDVDSENVETPDDNVDNV